ncbi:MAG: energy-coupling factor transporter transmembrane component T [Candidatus Thorarchaeota archaeon]
MVTLNLGFVEDNSALHRLNPAAKFFSLILAMTAILVYPSWILSGILLFSIVVGFLAAKASLSITSRRIQFLVIFSMVLFIVQILVTVNGTILFFIIPQIDAFGPLIPVTDYGIQRGLILSLRFLIVVFSSMLFVAVTDPTLLAHAFTKLRIPYRYAFALVIALRFLPLFDSETDAIRMAQKSRGLSTEIGSPSKLLRTLRYTFFPLLVSALSRVEALSLSMDGRGFGYSKSRTYLRESKWTIFDSIFLFFSFILLVLCIFLAVGWLPEISALI